MATARKGFNVMDRAQVREIASMGGRAAHAYGTAHQWTRETARIAGLKGVAAKRAKKAQLA
jgi:uncharacterized protein